jgi:polyhydroxybutyrate depolymerase
MRPDHFHRGVLAITPVALLFILLLAQGSEHIGVAASTYHAALLAPEATPVPAWPNDGAIDSPMSSTGCGLAAPVTPGTTAKQSFAVSPATNEGFTSRTYWVHVPTGYETSRPTALVLVFHGGGGTGIGMEAATGFSPFADQHQFLVVYPQGLPYAALGPGYTTWAATGPLDSLANGVDDLLFVSNLLDALQRQYCIDPQRIYATGFSAGGAMTAFLTCGLTGRIAAFAPMSGNAYQFIGGCFPHRPTSILEFHGSADPVEPYVGVPAREDPDWRRTGVIEWLMGWARRDGCTAGPSTFLQTSSAHGEQWTGCAQGRVVTHYLIYGLRHTWPPPIDGQSVLDIMWRVFETHPLQTA